jgi:hypothetical protein
MKALALVLLLTGCTSMDVKQHTLFCIILCIDMDTEMKKGDDPQAAAPTSLDGMISPQRADSRADSPAH